MYRTKCLLFFIKKLKRSLHLQLIKFTIDKWMTFAFWASLAQHKSVAVCVRWSQSGYFTGNYDTTGESPTRGSTQFGWMWHTWFLQKLYVHGFSSCLNRVTSTLLNVCLAVRSDQFVSFENNMFYFIKMIFFRLHCDRWNCNVKCYRNQFSIFC